MSQRQKRKRATYKPCVVCCDNTHPTLKCNNVVGSICFSCVHIYNQDNKFGDAVLRCLCPASHPVDDDAMGVYNEWLNDEGLKPERIKRRVRWDCDQTVYAVPKDVAEILEKHVPGAQGRHLAECANGHRIFFPWGGCAVVECAQCRVSVPSVRMTFSIGECTLEAWASLKNGTSIYAISNGRPENDLMKKIHLLLKRKLRKTVKDEFVNSISHRYCVLQKLSELARSAWVRNVRVDAANHVKKMSVTVELTTWTRVNFCVWCQESFDTPESYSAHGNHFNECPVYRASMRPRHWISFPTPWAVFNDMRIYREMSKNPTESKVADLLSCGVLERIERRPLLWSTSMLPEVLQGVELKLGTPVFDADEGLQVAVLVDVERGKLDKLTLRTELPLCKFIKKNMRLSVAGVCFSPTRKQMLLGSHPILGPGKKLFLRFNKICNNICKRRKNSCRALLTNSTAMSEPL